MFLTTTYILAYDLLNHLFYILSNNQNEKNTKSVDLVLLLCSIHSIYRDSFPSLKTYIFLPKIDQLILARMTYFIFSLCIKVSNTLAFSSFGSLSSAASSESIALSFQKFSSAVS